MGKPKAERAGVNESTYFEMGPLASSIWLDGLYCSISDVERQALQKYNAVAGRSLGLDCGPSSNNECGDCEPDKTRYCSPPMAKHNARAYAHQKHEQNR
jgi:hypothetical protein